jgi:hypothetical protein
MNQTCEEIRVFEGMAERTGGKVEIRGLKAHKNGCTSMRDLVRKYRILGDGHFYLCAGHWPDGKLTVSLDNVKWIGLDRAFQARQRFAPVPRVNAAEDQEP